MSEEPANPAGLQVYRLAARAWIAANLSRPADYDFERDGDPSADSVAGVRKVQARLHAAGYAGFTFPQEFGGAGLTLDHEQIFREESAGLNVPVQIFGVSINILGGTLAAYGTAAQKLRHLPKILSGTELWVQLLSEPSGGSDLAGLLTSATRDGEFYYVQGQKIWSSAAHLADFALCPVRTNWAVPKHRGISVLIVDLRAPGVEIRRIKQANGVSRFCEVFFNNVSVPVANLVGQENEGWGVARGLLEIEHAWVGRGGSRPNAGGDDLAEVVALARRTGQAGDTTVRRDICSLHVMAEVQRFAAARVSRGVTTGKMHPDCGSLLKLGGDALIQTQAALALRLAGLDGVTWAPAGDEAGRWAQEFLTSRSVSIAGGTDEILRNNVSERVLGLPRERAADRDIPFNQVPHN